METQWWSKGPASLGNVAKPRPLSFLGFLFFPLRMVKRIPSSPAAGTAKKCTWRALKGSENFYIGSIAKLLDGGIYASSNCDISRVACRSFFPGLRFDASTVTLTVVFLGCALIACLQPASIPFAKLSATARSQTDGGDVSVLE